MRFTCNYVFCMSTMIQIRNVPDSVHQRLKALAAMSGQSLSSFLLCEIERLAERPTLEELRARLRERSEVNPDVPIADMVREARETR